MTQPTHILFFPSFYQWLRKSTRVNPAQIVKKSLRWRLPLSIGLLPWLWKRNPKRTERAQRRELLLWAKPIDKWPLLASSRESELPSLLGQRCGVVKGQARDVQTVTYCVSSSSASPHLCQRLFFCPVRFIRLLVFSKKEITWTQEAKEYLKSCYLLMTFF